MINIEEQLNKLPRAKLSRKADWLLRFNFWKISQQVYWKNFYTIFSTGKLAPAAVAMFLLLSLISLPYYAYASDDVVRGDWLYPVKKGMEIIELSIAKTPAAKAEVYAKLAERRLSEAEKLGDNENKVENKGKDKNLAATINEMMALTARADEETRADLPAETKKTIADKMDKIKQKQLDKIEKIARQKGFQADDELLDSLALAIDDLKKEQQDKINTVKIFPKVDMATSTRTHDFKKPELSTTTNATLPATTTKRIKSSRTKAKTSQEATVESWSAAKNQVDTLKSSLLNEGLPNDELDNLFNKLDDRLHKAQTAIESGKLNQAKGLINSTEALGNNARHFFKNTERASTSLENLSEDNGNNFRENSKKRQNKEKK